LKEVDIYTDGACSGNPGPGGWAAILLYNGRRKELSGFEPWTTNQRMEIRAALEALKALKEPCRVRLHSDSAYLVQAFQKDWFAAWQKNGWLNSRKEPVVNQDLWRELLDLSRRHRVTWVKVKGHSDNALNNRCDALAREEIAKHRPPGES
jgi:ribonuclease HI